MKGTQVLFQQMLSKSLRVIYDFFNIKYLQAVCCYSQCVNIPLGKMD